MEKTDGFPPLSPLCCRELAAATLYQLAHRASASERPTHDIKRSNEDTALINIRLTSAASS